MSKQNLQEFILKAQKILEEKNIKKYDTLYIGAIDENIEIESLTMEELEEIRDYEDGEQRDAYLCYLGSPTLRNLASEMEKLGQIENYLDIIDILAPIDKLEIAKQILELSGLFEQTTVKKVDSIKK